MAKERKNNKKSGNIKAPHGSGKKSSVQKRMASMKNKATAKAKIVDDSHAVLEEIYTNENGEKHDMTKLEKRRPRWLKAVVGFIVVLAVVVGGWWYYAFMISEPESVDAIDLSIDLPGDIASGEEFTFIVDYKNAGAVSVRDVVLTMRYPAGFTFVSADVDHGERNNVWELGDLASGVSGSVAITGTLIGEIDSAKKFSATMTFVPDNFRSQFDMRADAATTIKRSLLTVDVAAPVSVAPGQVFTTTVAYHNTSSQPIEDMKIEADFPLDYALETATPDSAKQRWIFERLDAGEEGEITLTGTLDAAVGENRQLRFDVFIKDSNGEYQRQSTETALVLIVDTQLRLGLSVVSPADNIAKLGDEITYTVTYENTSDIVVKDVILDLALDNADDVLAMREEYVEVGDTVLVSIDASMHEALRELKPGDGGSFTVTVATTRNVPSDFDHHDIALPAKVAVSSITLEDGSMITSRQYESESVIVQFDGALNVLAEARYYNDEGIAVGSGALPPEVGETTTYQLRWYVTTTTSAVQKVTVTAKLPDYVFWVGTTSVNIGQSVHFDADTRTVSWYIPEVPMHAGTANIGSEATMTIAVTPRDDDEGSVLSLLHATSVEGVDGSTDTILRDTSAQLTTELAGDPVYVGDGKVAPSTEKTE